MSRNKNKKNLMSKKKDTIDVEETEISIIIYFLNNLYANCIFS